MMVAALYPCYSEFQRTAVSLPTMPDVPSDAPDAPYFHMPLYKTGAVVHYNGKREVVGYVVLRRSLLLVHLVGRAEPVEADKLSLAPSRFTLRRVAEKPGALISACAKPSPRLAGLHALVTNRD